MTGARAGDGVASSLLGQVGALLRSGDGMARLVHYAPGQAMAAHRHTFFGITLVVAGGFVDETPDRVAVCGPLTVIVKPAGILHRTRVGSAGALSLHFELAPGDAAALAEVGFAATRCLHVPAGHATALLLRFAGAEPLASVGRTIAPWLRTCLAAPPPACDAVAVDFAQRNTAATTGAAAAARGMHPVAFARRFRRATGWSPSAWRLQQRLALAATALAGSDVAGAGVAATAGFADQAHLYRLFKRETGLSPGDYRQLVRRLSSAGAGAGCVRSSRTAVGPASSWS